MEIAELKNVVLLFVLMGVILGIGVLVLDSFSSSVRDARTATDGRVNVSSGTATLSNKQCSAITSVINDSVGAASYDVVTYGVNITDKYACTIQAGLPVDYKYNITYSYNSNSTSTKALADVNNALQSISTNWLGLIITVVALSLILTLVISSFRTGGRQ